jgi:hypothetical protein
MLAAAFAVAASAFGAVSPARLLSSALTAAHAQRSVHYVMTQTSADHAVTMRLKITLSDWNESVEVAAPTGAIPIR